MFQRTVTPSGAMSLYIVS